MFLCIHTHKHTHRSADPILLYIISLLLSLCSGSFNQARTHTQYTALLISVSYPVLCVKRLAASGPPG